ncbi:NupC/NupG family nucleoside CNT transporter [Lederbergia citrea]|uniref:NupC/NupG family nucleoside CNT transporter n=1 Tax=Lederbergia citrea TaxID=2833581 RepID=A0A942UV27_9BACI|nr:nucleoside transporter C-terminal domain-containing protein [Lederbergia citrea]MBS4179434.1 NupC/NupG family nucleoside CNT transporter [Lederbergia citrea]MBS4206102.1 NupC/NupG family nucleoside CNT transporter [Lederbergia citrea]MBS4224449.1 NupC/NupG family nucleoside CNT transporter [Lederbergia citrea]
MNFIFLLTGILLVFVIGFLVSNDRKNIKYKRILTMLIVQILLVFFMMHTNIGLIAITKVGVFFEKLMKIANAGIEFVFGGILNQGEFSFFLGVLLPLVFMSVLIGLLNYIKVLPFIIKYIGLFLSKITGMGRLESYFAVSTSVLGQPEVFLTIIKQIPVLSQKRLYTICTSAMSAISMAMVGAYMTMLEPKFVVTAVVLNIFSALIVSNIINPYDLDEKEDLVQIEENERLPFFQMIGESVMDGFKIVIIVAAMLLGFIALMELINVMFLGVFQVSFQTVIGYLFAPIAFLMGVPWAEAVQAGGIMATKLITNEFVAMLKFGEITKHLSDKTIAIVSVYLVSFANFGTVGIVSGSIKSISEKQGAYVARFSLKLLLGATLASVISGTMMGLVL